MLGEAASDTVDTSASLAFVQDANEFGVTTRGQYVMGEHSSSCEDSKRHRIAESVLSCRVINERSDSG